MWKSFISASIRNLYRHKSYTIVNILGLALGTSVFIALALYIQFEFSFDKFHENAERIFRIEQIMDEGGRLEKMVGTPEPLWKVLENDFPEVETSMRLVGQELELTPDEGSAFVTNLFFVEHNFLKSFSFKLISGSIENALKEPFSMVVTETTARKLFGEKDPLGESFKLNNRNYEITGILEDVPDNSHMQFDLLVSINTLNTLYGSGQNIFTSWGNNWVRLLVMLKEGSNVNNFNEKIQFLLKDHYNSKTANELYTRSLLDIHLYSDLSDDYAVRGSIKNIYIQIAIAIFVLIMAGINFTNLSVAYSVTRANEIGLRKVNGATQRLLMLQYLTESVFIALVAIILGFTLFETLLPWFNKIVGRNLDFKYLENIHLFLLVISVGLFTGILAGLYPAIIISGFKPMALFKSKMLVANQQPILRKSLIVIQFFISTALIIGMLGVLRQSKYMITKDLGYNPENVLRVEFSDTSMLRIQRLQEVLTKNPDILSTSVHDYPVCQSTNWTRVSWDGAQKNEYIRMNINYSDHNYLDVYQMKLFEGNGFQGPQIGITGNGNRVIINRAALDMIQMKDPIGKKIRYGGDYRGQVIGNSATIVGVMDDYHFLSVHNVITPMMIRLYNEIMTGQSLSIRFRSADLQEMKIIIQNEFLKVFPELAFDYEFVDEFHASLYDEEKKMAKVVLYIAILANIIAGLGIYGLIAFTTTKRTKEIGLRKVLGANFKSISGLFSKELISLVIIANVISWPMAYFAIKKWLNVFPYRVGTALWPYLAALLITVLIAYIAMLFHTFKASRTNPANSLRYE